MTLAEDVLDELLPERVDWRRMVGRYPRAAIAVAAATGFLIGFRQGPAVLAAVGALAAGHATEAIGSLRGA